MSQVFYDLHETKTVVRKAMLIPYLIMFDFDICFLKVKSQTLKNLLEKKTYVKLTDDPNGQKLFWDKLRQGIRTARIEPFVLDETQPLINACTEGEQNGR